MIEVEEGWWTSEVHFILIYIWNMETKLILLVEHFYWTILRQIWNILFSNSVVVGIKTMFNFILMSVIYKQYKKIIYTYIINKLNNLASTANIYNWIKMWTSNMVLKSYSEYACLTFLRMQLLLNSPTFAFFFLWWIPDRHILISFLPPPPN